MNFYHLDCLAEAVRLKLAEAPAITTHALLTYKSLDMATLEIPQQEPPFIVIRDAQQTGPVGAARGYSYAHPYIDQTRAAIWIVSPMYVEVAGVRKGGFDTVHHPIVKRVRSLIQEQQAIPVPVAIQSEYKTGSVGLRMDTITGEDFTRLPSKQQERTVIFAVLYQHKTGGL